MYWIQISLGLKSPSSVLCRPLKIMEILKNGDVKYAKKKLHSAHFEAI